MKIYTIIGGINGVGKSSFTGVLKEQTTDLGVILVIRTTESSEAVTNFCWAKVW